MKKRQEWLALGAGLILVVVYLLGIGFYADRFTPRSHFASVGVGGLTMDQAMARLEDQIPQKEFRVLEDQEVLGSFTLSSVQVTEDLREPLEAYFDSLNPLAWPWALLAGSKAPLSPVPGLKFDKEDLSSQLSDLGIENEDRQAAQSAGLTYDPEEGYTIQASQDGNQIDWDRLEALISRALKTKSHRLDLAEAYDRPMVDSEDPRLVDYLEEIDRLTQTTITYQLAGDEVTIPRERIQDWLGFDSQNEIAFDGEGIADYLHELNETYSTFDQVRYFQSTNQGQVAIDPGVLGWSINVDEEVPRLIQELHQGEPVKREPEIYTTGGLANQADDIGPDYIEVDLTYQVMYLYKDHHLIYETPIVSGRAGAETIPGANAVLAMAQDTNLVGFNEIYQVSYSTPVSYWISFDYHEQGVHDATWQGSFDATQHYNNGSLGCINTPLDMAGLFYADAYIGMPVILFY